MSLDKGTRVMATRDLGGWFSSTNVNKGDTGVIIDTEGFFSTTYDVRFSNGDTVRNLEEKDIAEID